MKVKASFGRATSCIWCLGLPLFYSNKQLTLIKNKPSISVRVTKNPDKSKQIQVCSEDVREI